MLRYIALAAGLIAAGPALAQAPTVQVQNAWARATSATGTTGGIFLTLTDSGAPDRLVGAATPVAAQADVHETINDNGVMKMRPVAGGLPLPPGQPVELKPGGYHVMLMGLKQQLKPGDTFPVTLTFQHAAPVTAMVKVGAAGASGPDMAMAPGMAPMSKP